MNTCSLYQPLAFKLSLCPVPQLFCQLCITSVFAWLRFLGNWGVILPRVATLEVCTCGNIQTCVGSFFGAAVNPQALEDWLEIEPSSLCVQVSGRENRG